MSRVGARVCGSGAEREDSEVGLCRKVILIKKSKSHSCGDDFGFGCDDDGRSLT